MNRNRTSPASSSSPTSSKPKAKGAAMQILVAAIAMGAVSWMGISSVMTSSTVPKVSKRSNPTPIEVEAALGQLGLTPKVMAAANLTAQKTGAFAAAAAGHIRSNIAAYRAAQEAVQNARNSSVRLRKLVQGTAATEQMLTDLASAEASLETARGQQQTILTAAFAAGAEELTGAESSLLGTFRLNKMKWSISERYLGDNRTESEWLILRDAVANDRIAGQLGQDPDPTAHQVLVTAQGTTNSSAANTNMANLAEIQAAWTAAMTP